MIVRELVTLLGFDIEDEKLKKFDEEVDNTKTRLLAMGAAVVAASAAVFALVKTSANTADSIKSIANMAGVTTEELQKMGYAGQLAGATLEDVGTGFKFLNKNAQEAAKDAGGEVGQQFKKLGINVKGANGEVKSASELFLELNKSFQNLDRGQRAAAALKVLGRSGGGLVEMLSESPEKIDMLMREAEAFGGIMTDDQIEQLGEFNDGVDRTIALVGFLKNQIALALGPQLIDLMNTFREWMVTNREIIRANLTGFFMGLTRVLKVIWLVVLGFTQAFNKLIDLFGIGERAVTAFFAALALLFAATTIAGLKLLIGVVSTLGTTFLIAWAKALAPIALILAAIALIVIAIEDVITGLMGGESYTKDFLDYVSGLWSTLKQMANDEGLSIGRIFGIALSQGFWAAFKEVVPSVGNLMGKVLLAMPGIKFMQTDWSKQLQLDNPRAPMIPGSMIAQNDNRGGTTVNANTTVTVPAGTDPGMVGDRVESGVRGSVDQTLRQAGRATAPASGY